MEDYNIIPLEANSGYSFDIALENIQYTFTVHWNVFEEAYYLDIYSVTNSVDIKGIKLVTRVDLLAAYPINELGSLHILDFSGSFSEPTFDSIDSTHQMIYVPTTNTDAII